MTSLLQVPFRKQNKQTNLALQDGSFFAALSTGIKIFSWNNISFY